MSEPVALDAWNASAEGADTASVGSKAAGLLALPRAWVPRWAVARPERAGWQPAREVCARVLQCTGRWVVVRSNGPSERTSPGEGRTFVLASSHIDRLLDALAGELASGQWPIVQAAVDPALLGVMSNERRVCCDPSEWLIEGAVHLQGPEAVTIKAAAGPTLHGPLNVTSSDQLTRTLARVAGYLNALFADHRVRCEWAWDGRQVWVLQVDVQPPTPVGVGDTWLERQSSAWTPPLEPAPPVRGGWAKAESLRLFARQGLPTLITVCISPAQWDAGSVERLLADAGLEASAERPLSVRTDTRAPGRSLLAPTSGACEDPDAVARFMTRAARAFTAAKVNERDWAFLATPWVDARAGAWARGRPRGELVNIDAIWGHADGLQALPHDSFTVNLKDGTVAEQVRHKPLLLRADTDAPRYEALGEGWDWRASLTPPEALRAAEWCQRLADALDSETQLLILAAINGLRQPDAMLPIFHLATAISQTPMRRRPMTAAIASASDARRLPPGTLAVELRLPADQLRNVDELREIAEVARAASLPVVVPGSQLGHTLYILRAAGAQAISAQQTNDDALEWTTCLIARERSISRIMALPRARATQFARDSLTAAQRTGSGSAIERARRTLASLEAIGANATTPKGVAQLPVLDERAAGKIDDLDIDGRGQPLVHLS